LVPATAAAAVVVVVVVAVVVAALGEHFHRRQPQRRDAKEFSGSWSTFSSQTTPPR
jgi:hypothetical protein